MVTELISPAVRELSGLRRGPDDQTVGYQTADPLSAIADVAAVLAKAEAGGVHAAELAALGGRLRQLPSPRPGCCRARRWSRLRTCRAWRNCPSHRLARPVTCSAS